MGRWLLVLLGLLTPAAAEERRSGFEFMSRETQALQRDDFANPGMLSVAEGEALWSRPAGTSGVACAGCHAEGSMRGVAARYPAWDAGSGRAIDLQGRVELCRTERQGAPALPPESNDRLALSAWVAHQSHGLPIAPPEDERLAPGRERGGALYRRRLGQLNLSCAGCHDDKAGGRLGGAPIPQAHPTGYPLYRLEWQELGSLQRRFRNCMSGVRAEPYDYGAAEWVDLELFLMSRARGMPLESPAVRP